MRKSLAYCVILLLVPSAFGSPFTDSIQTLIQTTQSNNAKPYVAMAQYYLAINTDSSIFYSKKAKTIGKNTNNFLAVIRSLSIEGEALMHKRQLPQAVASYLKAIKLSKEKKIYQVLGSIYNGIGICYYEMNDFQKTEHYIKLAAEAKLANKEYTYYTVILSNLASIYVRNGSYNKAFNALFKAEKTLLEAKKDKYLTNVYNTLGACYQMSNPQSDSILYFYQKSLDFALKYKIQLSVITAYSNIGDYYLRNGNFNKAIENFKKAETLYHNKPDDQYKLRIYKNLSQIYDSLGNFKKALAYKQLQYKCSQNIFSIENKKIVEELDIKYQTLQKERKINQQNKEISEGKYLRNLVIFIAIAVLIIVLIIVYFFYQRNKSKQQFEHDKLKLFENIVHEIRTPLTLINGPLQIIKENEGKNASKQIELIEKNTQKLNNLINELLDASKLGKGKYQLSYNTGEIETFFSALIANFEMAGNEKNMTITYLHTGENQLYSLPLNALEKIVYNLVGNAIKYCKSGTKITIETSVENAKLYLKVQDNGGGIAKKDQKKIFDRFYRGTYNTDVTGTGIGLALVKDLVDLSQGEIQFNSNESGTIFNISIPIETVEQSSMNAIKSEDKPTLLLVEDNTDIVDFVTSFMTDSFTIITAPNGKIALEKINETLPEIILTDIMMSEMDGIELLQAIKSNELTDHIPVVVFSAKGSLESRLEGLNKGADAYIPKPFSPEELRLTIQNLFKTIQINQEAYKIALETDKKFEERIKSTNTFVNKMIAFVVQNIDDTTYSVNELSDDAAVSRSQLHRKLSATTGLSTTNFIRMIRLEKAKDLLKEGELNVTEIAYQCGFNSQSYFTKSFTEYFGENPSKFNA